MANSTFHAGSTSISKIRETDLNSITLLQLMPGLDAAALALHPEWLSPDTTDAAGHALLSVHTWLVRHDNMTILIDTGAGNDKSRPQQPVLDHLSNPFLERLAHTGVTPQAVDYVLHTHIHSDHVGWNTRLESGEWIPTFPNAEIICSAREWRYGEALDAGDEAAIAAARREADLGEPVRIPVSGTFADSMRPLAGRVRQVAVNGQEVLPGVRFLPTPGHSIDHAAIQIEVGGQVIIFGGDVLHHPLEIYDPTLVSVFCEFPDAARRSRAWLLNHVAARNALYFSSHFPRSSAGHITRGGDGFCWVFVEPQT